MSTRYTDLITALQSVWTQLDDEVARYQAAAGYRCIPGCGRCCEYPGIEVTILDCLPAVAAQFAGMTYDDVVLWFQEFTDPPAAARDNISDPGICPFYKASAPGRGACGAYRNRPALCRLFGFAAVRLKSGQAEVALCNPLHKQMVPPPAAIEDELTGSAVHAPMFEQWARHIAAIDPGLGSRYHPIAEAFRQAGELLLQAWGYDGLCAASAGQAAPTEPAPPQC